MPDESDSQKRESVINAMKNAQPSWKNDTLGVRGNAIQFFREQIPNNVLPSTVSRRSMDAGEVERIIANSADTAANDPPNGSSPPTPSPNPFNPPNPDPDDEPEIPPGVNQIMSAIRGQDVGFPGDPADSTNWGILYEDIAYIYETVDSAFPTTVHAQDMAEGETMTVYGVVLYRQDKRFDNTHDGTYLKAQAHFDGIGTAGPAYRIYAPDVVP